MTPQTAPSELSDSMIHRVSADDSAERRCIVTGVCQPKQMMVRFVVGPGDVVVPDLAGDLPGRGIWLCARRDVVHTACAKGRFAAASRRAVQASPSLADDVESLLVRRCLDSLGLARRAGEAVCGFEKVKAMLVDGLAGVLLGASDGAPEGRAKLSAMAGGTHVVTLLTNAEMAGTLGRENVVHAAVRHGGLARRLRLDAERLTGFRNPGANVRQ